MLRVLRKVYHKPPRETLSAERRATVAAEADVLKRDVARRLLRIEATISAEEAASKRR